MGFTKKAISVGLSATMLATLLATAVAGTAFAAAAPTIGTFSATSVPINGTASFTPAALAFASSGDLTSANLVITLPANFTFTAGSSTAAPTVTSGAGCAAGTGAYNLGLTTVTYSMTANTAACTVTFPALTVTTATFGATGSVSATGSALAVALPGLPAGAVGTLNALAPASLTSQGTLYPWYATPTSSSLPANGLSSYTITFKTPAPTPGDVTALQLSVTGGYFLSGSSTFAATSTLTYPRTSILLTSSSNVSVAAGSTLQVAATTAGTVLFTVQYASTSLGTNYDSSYAFTFTGATSTTVSTAYSSTALSPTSASATVGTPSGITTKVRDTNNNAIVSGALVSWTLSGPAVFQGTSSQVSSNNVANSSGVATATLVSTGIAGVVTVATTVSYLGVTYTLPNETVTFVGDVAKAVGTVNDSSVATNTTAISSQPSLVLSDTSATLPASSNDALSVKVTDASGNPIGTALSTGVISAADPVTFTSAYTPANIFTIKPEMYDETNDVWDFGVTCVTDGTATVTITAKSALSTATASTTALSITCADALTSSTAGTFTATASSTTVAPNGTATITVNVLDDNKLPAPDGTPVLAVTNGVGNVVSSGGTIGSSTTSSGSAKFTYLAPANAGSGTVTVFVGSATPASQAITFTIGTPAPAVSYTAASALGVTTSGPFSTATKLPKIGKYVTVKFSFGAANAGKTVIIDVATKTSGVWSAFKGLTTRVANSNGDVFFYWKSSSASWLSIYGDLGGAHSNSVQARWM